VCIYIHMHRGSSREGVARHLFREQCTSEICLHVLLCIYMFLHVHVLVHTLTCIYIYIYTYICMYTYTYTYVYICICICMYIDTQAQQRGERCFGCCVASSVPLMFAVYMYFCTYVLHTCICTCTHTHIYIYMYIYLYVCIHLHIYMYTHSYVRIDAVAGRALLGFVSSAPQKLIVYVYLCAYILYTCICTCTHTYIHIRIYIYM